MISPEDSSGIQNSAIPDFMPPLKGQQPDHGAGKAAGHGSRHQRLERQSDTTSSRRSGISALMPAIRMPTLAKLAKPHMA